MPESQSDDARAYLRARAEGVLWDVLAGRLAGREPKAAQGGVVLMARHPDAAEEPEPDWSAAVWSADTGQLADPWRSAGPGLDAFVAIGALTPAEATVWAERLDAATPQPLDDDLRATALQDMKAARATYQAADGLERDHAGDDAVTLGMALHAAGLITEDEELDFGVDFEEDLDELEGRWPALDRPLRVIGCDPGDHPSFRPTLVELYEDGIVLHSQSIGITIDLRFHWGVLREAMHGPPELRDDLGNTYDCRGWGAHGAPLSRAASTYVPGLDAAATALIITAHDSTIEVPV